MHGAKFEGGFGGAGSAARGADAGGFVVKAQSKVQFDEFASKIEPGKKLPLLQSPRDIHSQDW